MLARHCPLPFAVAFTKSALDNRINFAYMHKVLKAVPGTMAQALPLVGSQLQAASGSCKSL